MRRRGGRHADKNPGVRPIQRIELSEHAPKKRLIAIILLAVLALGIVAVALVNYLTPERGFTEIEAYGPSAESASHELMLQYDLGRGENSPTKEKKALTTLYTEICEQAGGIFSAESAYGTVNNPYYINRHAGEELTVPEALYAAFEMFERHGSRLLYAAPFYTDYGHLFSSTEDFEAAEFDPAKSPEQAAYVTALAAFTGNPEAVRLELLGNNRVKLHVSPEYRAFADANGITSFIDFYWMENAFAVDYVANALVQSGFTHGYLTSKDGFTRNLDTDGTGYSYNLFAKVGTTAYPAARWDYVGKHSIVTLRTFALYESDERYYTYGDGSARFPYIDPADGLCKSNLPSITGYAEDTGCAEVLLSLLPAIFAPQTDTAHLTAIAARGIHTVYAVDKTLYYTQADMTLSALLTEQGFTAKAQE